MGDGVEVWRGGVNTWECDAMGHLNVRFYVAKAIEGLAGFAAVLGLTRAFSPAAEATLLVREQHVRFLREARPGAGLSLEAGVLEMGEAEARVLLTMRHLSGEPAAAFQTVVAHVTPGEGRPFPWPRRVVERAEALKVPLPDFAQPRSIALQPVHTEASLARAEALGVAAVGLGVISPQDCDVFGRMRPELFIGRISDGIPRILPKRDGPSAPGSPRLGGAALEYRLLHFAWPRAGDRIELRSAITECEPRVRRLRHWLLDPDTGRPWGSAEAIVVALDLDARKIADLSPEALAAGRAAAIGEMGL